MKIKHRSSIIKNIIITVILLTLAACTFNEPVLPKWFTFWELPFPETTFEMSDAIDNENIFADTTVQGIPIISLSIKDNMAKEGISKKDLSIQPDPDTLAKSIIDISISSPDPEITNPTNIQELLPFQILVGDTIDIPDISVPLPAQNLDFSSFQFAMVRKGKVSLVFHNHTFLTIKPGMQVDVYDDSTGNLAGIPFGEHIGTAVFDSIGPYSSVPANDSLDLMNKLISHKLRLGEVQVPLQPENDHEVIPSDTAGYVQNELTISDLTVSQARAEIPMQTTSESGAKSIEDRENRVRSAKVDSGQIIYHVENQLAVEATVLITMPNFIDENGDTLTQVKVIPKQFMETDSFKLVGYEMINHINASELIDSVYYNMYIETTPTNEKVSISDKDSVIVSFFPDSIFFSEFDGIVDTVQVEIDTVKKKDIFDYKDFEGAISLEDLEMELTLFNELGIPVEIEVNILGEHRNSATGELEDTLSLDPIIIQLNSGANGFPDTTIVPLNASNSKIVELMQILPTDIVMNGKATIMGDGFITINDSIWGEYEIYSQMNILVDSIPPYETEIDTLQDFDDDVRDAIEERFQEAKIQLDIDYGLPISADLILAFGSDTSDFFVSDTSDSSKLIIDHIKLQAAPIGSNGYVSSPVQDKIYINLDQDQLKIFSKDTLLMGSKIIFLDRDKRMKFRSTDALNIDGALRVKVLMKED